MSKSTCIHIFRRDYRLDDNTTLIEACKTHDIVIPIFIFTSKQIDKKKNVYRSDNSVQFLCESLADLDKQLKLHKRQLYIFYDDSRTNEFDIIESLIKMKGIESHLDIKTISFNMDYTHYSKQRDSQIEKLCKTHNINCLVKDDICLNPIGSVLNGSGNPYTKYTPFWKASASRDIRKPHKNSNYNYLETNTSLANKLKKHPFAITIDEVMKPEGKIMASINEKIPERGGRDNGLLILKGITEWKDYDEKRDLLSYKTTHLSPFNKFGCVSIREVYWTMRNKLGKDNGVIRQLFWRDFFYNLSHFHPEIYVESALNPKYIHIKWKTDPTKFKAWCEAKTGFPVVDACMRELNTTGYMHNRGRLIVSSFLCRMLSIDWKEGERYFAQKLYDYDPAQNNFGWQVSGANSSGTTSRPLEQTILNPWRQSIQFDKEGTYIKKWCPELENVKASHLHKWNEYAKEYISKGVKYLEPIIDYNVEKANNLKLYEKGF